MPFDYLCIHTNGCKSAGLTSLPASIHLELRTTRHHRETLQEKKKMYIDIENHIEIRKTEATCVSVSGSELGFERERRKNPKTHLGVLENFACHASIGRGVSYS